MEKKIVNIFIGTSRNELKNESEALENFVYSLNDDLRSSNVEITPIVLTEDNEDEIDSLVQASDLSFFIFFKRVDDDVHRLFHEAFDAFKANDKPKVYIFFKNVPAGEEEDRSLPPFKEEVDKSYRHFYGNFDYIDTIKLKMLMGMKFTSLGFIQLEADGDTLKLNGKAVDELDLDKVSEYVNSKELKALQEELNEIEEKFLQMKPLYFKCNQDDEFYKQFAAVQAKRDKLKKDIEDLQENLFELSLGMMRNYTKGMTPRMKEAYRLLEQGDKESCVQLLRDPDNAAEYKERQNMRKARIARIYEEAKEDARNYISEQRLAIKVLQTMYQYKNRYEEIDRIYKEEILPNAEEYSVELSVLYSCAEFLYDQNRHLEAITYAEKLKKYYDDGVVQATEADKVDLYNLLGGLYSDTQRHKEAAEYYTKALEICKRSAKANPAAYEPDLAASYNNLGILYSDIQRFKEAEECHKKALEIRERLAKENPAAYEPDLAISYNNLGALYADIQRHKEAEECHKKALEIYERLAKENPAAYEPDLAISYNNLGNLYSDIQRFKEAEECHKKALEIRERLAKENPAAYEPDLAISYNNLGALYADIQRHKEAEECHKKALEIYERLAKENPAAYEPDLAISYNNLGNLYSDIQRFKEAEECHKKALEIRERLAKENPAAYEPDLAISYNNLGALYADIQRHKEAEECHKKALEIYERLAKENPAAYEPDLADSYFRLGIICVIQVKIEEAEDSLTKALHLYEKLEKSDPEKYREKEEICKKIIAAIKEAKNS